MSNYIRNIENNKILRPHIVICEGIDDQMFLFWLLKKQEFLGDGKYPFFQIITADGKDNLKNKLNALQNQEGFFDEINQIKSISVIFDADNNIAKSILNIKRAFQDASLSVPESPGIKKLDSCSKFPHIATGFLLFPQLNNTPQIGDIETLCLNLFSTSNAEDIKTYIEEGISRFGSGVFKTPNKNRLHGFLSFTDEYVGKTLGHAAELGAFKSDSPDLIYLQKFLNQMIE